MTFVFWFSLAIIGYAYAGYPAWLYLRAKFFPCPVRPSLMFPKISIVMAVRNEEANLRQKIENLRGLDYPEDRLEIVVISDGSTDGTNETLSQTIFPGFRSAVLQEHAGKAAALELGVQTASGEIVIFTDVRQRLDDSSVSRLVENFADPEVGCVSGALDLSGRGADSRTRGVRTYWNLEKKIREWESLSGSVIGATGALYAVRKDLIPALPAGLILDDVLIPLDVVRQGKRVVFDSRSIAYDGLSKNLRQEFRRKVRTLLGNYQLLQVAPWLLTRKNPARFEFVSHKLIRLAVPFASLAVVASSLYISGRFYVLPLAVAACIGILAMLRYLKMAPGIIRPFGDMALTFLMLNSAAAVALIYFLSGKKQVWVR